MKGVQCPKGVQNVFVMLQVNLILPWPSSEQGGANVPSLVTWCLSPRMCDNDQPLLVHQRTNVIPKTLQFPLSAVSLLQSTPENLLSLSLHQCVSTVASPFFSGFHSSLPVCLLSVLQIKRHAQAISFYRIEIILRCGQFPYET